jgi:hypothetical protein
MLNAVPTVAIIFVAEAMVADVVVESVRDPTSVIAITTAMAIPKRRFPPTSTTLVAPVKEALAVVLTPSVAPDHAGEPEQRDRAGDKSGADDRPFAAARHERARDDPNALEEKDDTREQRDEGDDTNGGSHDRSSVRTTI